MASINQVKQLRESETPLLLFECILPSGDIERWCTHGAFLNGAYFEARVLQHDLFDLQLSADDAMDGLSRLSLVLANADSALSELNASIGFKGAQLTVYFGFADLPSMQVTTETTTLFKGVAGDPDEIREDSLTLSFVNKLGLQRIPLPEVRIQRTCPWNFPLVQIQRQEAVDGGASRQFSRFYRCGYSADIPNGRGNLDVNGHAFTSCDKSRSQCEARGMFDTDSRQQATKRFGGLEFVPSAVSVRTAGDKASHLSPVLNNTAKYNDPVPLVYGTAWLKAPIIFSRNDGNLTHMEVLLGLGPVAGVLKVVVNDVEIPLAVTGQDMNTTGWYSTLSAGSTQGAFNLDFLDTTGKPLGDPYGSIAVMSVVVPNRISSGTSLPTVEVLMQGLKLDSFTGAGQLAASDFSNNPAWVTLDVLRRCGWSLGEVDLSSFSKSADYCAQQITSTDVNGNEIHLPRFQCNLVLSKRQSAASVIRGVRTASSLMLRYGSSGLLELVPEATLAIQQPAPPDGTNSTESLNTGWPAYEFSDQSAAFSGIVRAESGESTVLLVSRSVAESSNRLSIEFQDDANEFQQDSLSVVDSNDSALMGYEISSQSTALGIPNYNQATRVLLRQLDKSLKGNLFVEFQTSFRALKVRPGDIITLTYLKEGFQRTPFRIVKLAPSTNYALVTVTAQIHNDDWYSDDIRVLTGAGRQPSALVQSPRPLIGLVFSQQGGPAGYFDFLVTEAVQTLSDGTALDLLTVSFANPTKPSRNAPRVPLVSLAPLVSSEGGTLSGQSTYYYAVSAVDAQGQEGPLSFTIRASVEAFTNSNSVTLQSLSFPSNAASFNVYRGASPQLLYRVATMVALASTFTDTGAAPQPLGPPDASFDHANFYYRYETAGPFRTSSASTRSIQCDDLGATIGAYTGMIVRITAGTGKGQERSIANNTAMSLSLASDWLVVPDAASTFVICESTWRFAGTSDVSPVQFSLPYRAKTVVQITGRAANVHNQEGTPELCPLTRIALGQSKADFGVPSAPSYLLQAPGAGQLTLSEIGFSSDDNVASVSSGTLNLYYWSELTGTNMSLQSSIDNVSSAISFSSALDLTGTRFFQVGTEILYVLIQIANQSNSYYVLRGQLGSSVTSQPAGVPVVPLVNGKLVVPFATDFFQNRASVNVIHSFNLPDVRVAAAEFFVTNGFGSSQATTTCFTGSDSGGLRTLSGGQFSLQISGYVGSIQNATPPLLVETAHAIRDVRATLGQPSVGYDTRINVFQDQILLCSLAIPAGATSSNLIDGSQLAALRKEALLTANISQSLTAQASANAKPAKDLTTTIRM